MPEWLKQVAPTVFAALTGPLGALAAPLVAEALGASDKTVAGVKAVLTSGQMTGDQVAAIKQAEQALKLKEGEWGVRFEELATADRASARAMQIANKSRVPAILTAAIVGAFVSTLVLLVLRDVPTSNRDIVVYMIGQLSGGFTSALAFWLGTTSQSERKTNLLAAK